MKNIIKNRWMLLFNLLILTQTAFCQIKISGVVNDQELGEALAGVSVVEAGTQNGTMTDLDGKYVINVSGKRARLIFSFIGKEKIKVDIGNQKTINIEMPDLVNNLTELVVVGYGNMKKSDLTGSVSSLKSDVLEESSRSSFTSALSGRMAGVLAVQSGGAPGSGIEIKIRGASSVSGGTSPLYVVDGVMMGNSQSEVSAGSRMGDYSFDPMSSINPNDIESIEVLKDASATAIYGSRGANGVVLITTKSGTKDGSQVLNFSASLGISFKPQKSIRSLSGSDYEDYMRLRYPLPNGFEPGVSELPEDLANYWNPDGTPIYSGINTVWADKIFQTGISQNYNLSYRGSAKKNRYSLSIGYYDTEGIVKTSELNRLTYSGKLDNTMNKYISLGINLSGAMMENRGIVSTAQTSSNIFTQIFMFRPNITEGDISGEMDTEDPGSNVNNPMNTLMNIKQISESRRTQGNAYVSINPIKELTIKSTFGGYFTDAKGKNYYPATTGAGRLDNGRVQHATTKTTNFLNENTISYNKNFKKIHSLSLLGGVTFQRTDFEEYSVATTNIEIDNLDLESLKFGSNILPPVNSKSYYTLMSYLGRVNYSLMDKYLLTGSIRADGSSKFSPGNKFSYFPSGAFAWKMNNENFMKSIKEIDQLKLRVSYGKTGNQGIGSLSTLALLNKVYYSFNTDQGGIGNPTISTGMVPSSIGNSKLKWETTDQYNAGIDLMAFNSRINFSADLYYKYTTDLLITEQLPSISGFTSCVRNVGSVSNKGLELSISSINISNNHFTWNTDFNITFNRNKVLDIGGGDRIAITPGAIMQGHYQDVFYVKEGYPIGAMFGYKTDGLYQCRDFQEFYDTNGQFISDPVQQRTIYNNNKSFTLRDGVVDRGSAVKPGYVKFEKQGDGQIINSTQDRVYLGSAEPKFFGGLNNRFSFKGFELGVFFQFSYGNKLFNANNGLINGRSSNNIEENYYNNMWLIDRQNGNRHHFQDTFGRETTSDLQVEDASYLKLKELTFSYRLPRKLLNKYGIKNARVSLVGSNLFTWTKYSWYDPEVSHNNPLTRALDKYAYPMSRSCMCTLSLDF